MNYFKDLKTGNKETLQRDIEKPMSLKEAAAYDKKFVNKILNKPIPNEADKYNIARVIEWFDYNLNEIHDTAVGMEKVIRETLGDQTFDALTKKYINEKMKEFEARLNE